MIPSGWSAAVGRLVHRLVPRTRPGRIGAALGAGLVLIAAGLLIVLLPSGQRTPPSPSRPAPVAEAPRSVVTTSHSASPRTARTSASAKPKATCTGRRSSDGSGSTAPTHLCIPAIGVDTSMLQLGLNPDHTVEVPALSQVGLAGWYRYSPAPGTDGPAVILGHVDSAQYGKGVFFDLSHLVAGNTVTFFRADGKIAVYRVDRVQQYPKSSFPTQEIYGNTPKPTMRLITCGGQFDSQARSYLDNIVVFGTIVSLS